MGDLFKRLDHEQRALHDSWDDVVRVLFVVSMMSAAVWSLCSALRFVVHAGSDWLVHHVAGAPSPWAWAVLLGVLVVGGLARGALLRRPGWDETAGDGMDVALANYHSTYDHAGDDPRPRFERPAFGLALRKAAATALTLATGGSGGLEAPVVVIGEAVGAGWARVFRVRSEHELRTYQLAGIAAAVTTLLGAPFAGALFAIEFCYGDRIIYRKFAYALLAGLVAYTLNQRFIGLEPIFSAPPHARSHTLAEYGITALVAITVSAPVALAFGRLMAKTADLVGKVSLVFRGAVGALGTGLVALLLSVAAGIPAHHVLGMGEHTLAELLRPGATFPIHVLLLAAMGKMITTGLTIRSGGSAGMLIPSMFLGGVSGALMGEVLRRTGVLPELDLALLVVVGIASALVAVIGVPLAAIALVLEVFGAAYGPPALLSCGVTYVLTLRIRVYGNQRMSPDPDADETGFADAGEAADAGAAAGMEGRPEGEP
ncbi:chloride channel protein [Polyangium spumosum]|uniref:Chloride channel protein n=2 Tax=Polyangium spumosum TaxID=889282 RepID=A0A6N7PVZ4_9BACT|nr:chloride channel protein [Polyangium spumosum]